MKDEKGVINKASKRVYTLIDIIMLNHGWGKQIHQKAEAGGHNRADHDRAQPHSRTLPSTVLRDSAVQ